MSADDTERPVEELIGWEPNPVILNHPWAAWWNPIERKWRRRAEVDDLADWLREATEGLPVDIESGWDTTRDGIFDVWLVTCRFPGDAPIEAWGSTIRAALVAAVRAVSKTETT